MLRKVVIFATVWGTGGIQMNARGLARFLTDHNCKLLILSSKLDEGTAGGARERENEILYARGVVVITLERKDSLMSRVREFMRLRGIVKAFDPDFLWGSGTSWHMGLIAASLGRKVRRIFYECMSGDVEGLLDPRWFVRAFFDEVVGQSPRVSSAFARSTYWRRKVDSIPAYPEPLEVVATLPSVSRKRVEFGAARAAFFSRLVEGKQAFWLIQQWRVLRKWVSVLHFYGDGPERPLIEKYIADEGIGDKVRCLGRYPSGQAYVDILAGYDVTLLPTVFPEGAPLVLLESMACGVPFVANGVGGIPDYINNNPDCHVVAEQSQFLEGLRSFLQRLSQGEISQTRLQQHYLRHYSRAAIDAQWKHLFGLEGMQAPCE